MYGQNMNAETCAAKAFIAVAVHTMQSETNINQLRWQRIPHQFPLYAERQKIPPDQKKKKKQRVGDSCWFLFIYSLILIHCRRQGSEKLLVNGNAFSINHWKLIFPSPTPFHSFPNISTNCACLCVCDVGWHFLVLFWKLLCLALIDFQLFSSLLAGN